MHKMRAAVLILFLASSLAFGGCLMRQRTGKDGKGPEISMDNSEISVSIHADEAELLSGVTAYDAKDGDVTDSLAVEHISNFIEKGRRKISIVAFDSDNNVTHAEREMVYNDYTSPVFSLDGALRFSVNADDLTEGLSGWNDYGPHPALVSGRDQQYARAVSGNVFCSQPCRGCDESSGDGGTLRSGRGERKAADYPERLPDSSGSAAAI